MTTVRIVGAGRAGLSFHDALVASGIEVVAVLGRGDELTVAAEDVDVLLLAVPDDAVVEVAAAVAPVAATVVAHCSGVLGLDVLAGHPRAASVHPLVTLPDRATGSARLRSGAHFAIDGDDAVGALVSALGGSVLRVPAAARPAYHAAACITANHLVALLGQVERVAALAGLGLDAYLPLAQGALEDVRALGPAAALTGPAARGDTATLERHRRAIGESEVAAYDACVALAQRLAAPGAGR